MASSFIKDDKGGVGIFVALGLVVAIGITGIAIDTSRYTSLKSEFRNAVDQAVLATAAGSAGMSKSEMQLYAQDYFNANLPADRRGDFKLDSFVLEYDASNYEWKGTAEGSITTSLSSLLGTSKVELTHEAVAKWDEISTEIVFAVDISASMCADFDPARRGEGVLKVVPDPACKKLAAVRQALTYLIAGDNSAGWTGLPNLTTRDGRPAYKIGIVPFNHKVKFPNVNSIPALLTAQEPDPTYFKVFNSDPGAAETASFPLPAITPLVALNTAEGRENLIASVNKLQTSHEVPGWTRSNVGLLTASLMLDPQYQQHYNGAKPSNFGKSNDKKIVFLLTDGANTGCCFSDHPTGTFQQQYLYNYRTDSDFMDGGPTNGKGGLCAVMKERNIEIYTIVYDVVATDALGGGARIKQVMQNCASDQQDTFYDLDASNGAQIAEAYKDIANKLTLIRLAK